MSAAGALEPSDLAASAMQGAAMAAQLAKQAAEITGKWLLGCRVRKHGYLATCASFMPDHTMR